MDQEANLLKVLGDPIRLRLAVLLSGQEEICVCKLTEALDEPQFKISRHLGVMRNAGLVHARREGTWMYYRLADPDNTLTECLHDYFNRCRNEHCVAGMDRQRLKKSQCNK